jgi:hypothetical protein
MRDFLNLTHFPLQSILFSLLIKVVAGMSAIEPALFFKNLLKCNNIFWLASNLAPGN